MAADSRLQVHLSLTRNYVTNHRPTAIERRFRVSVCMFVGLALVPSIVARHMCGIVSIQSVF